jgi:S1-C subfamily serine protease
MRPLALSFALALACFALPRAASALDLPELAALAKPSVVLLQVSDMSHEKAGVGTGFFVSKDGRVITNHHVIDGATRVVAVLPDGRTIDILGILADDEARDIAILQAAAGDYTPLTLGTSTALRMGDEIAIVGSPLGLSGSLSSGIVSAVRESGPKTAFGDSKDERLASWGLQVTAAISPGSSGSPILLRSGEVVAVAVGRINGGEGLNFGIPIEVPKAMMDGVPPGAKPKAFTRGGDGNKTLQNLGISAAVFGVPYLGWTVVAAWKKRARRQKERQLRRPLS